MDRHEEIASLCVRELSLILDVAPEAIDPSATFSELGLDSAMAVHLILAVEEKLRIELDPDILNLHPTLASFCAYLSGQS